MVYGLTRNEWDSLGMVTGHCSETGFSQSQNLKEGASGGNHEGILD